MIIPPDAPLDVREAFADLNRRLSKIERPRAATVSVADLNKVIDQLRNEIAAATRLPEQLDQHEFELMHRVPLVQLTHSVDQSINSGAITVLTFDTETINPNAMHSIGTNPTRITIQIPGVYLFISHVNWESLNGTGRRQTLIYANGTNTVRIGSTEQAIVQTATIQIAMGMERLTTGDYVETAVFQSSGVAVKVMATANGPSPRFWGILVGK